VKPRDAKPANLLNERQAAFARAYTSGPTLGVGSASAKAAGYAGDSRSLETVASRLLRHVGVAAEISRLRKLAEDASIMDARERRQFWSKVARGEVTEKVVVGRGENATTEDVCPLTSRLRATELLGKAAGDFVERREVSGPGGGPIELGFSRDLARVELEKRVRDRYGNGAKADEMLELLLGAGTDGKAA
jgi:phage terminase small subunit